VIIVAFFTDGGSPKLGLTPVMDVWKIDGTHTVSGTNMVEVNGGFYYYDFTGYNETEDYCFRADGGTTLSANDRYVYGTNEVGQVTTDITNVKTKTDKLQFDVFNNTQCRVNDKGVLNNPPTVGDIDTQLTSSHGNGNWTTSSGEYDTTLSRIQNDLDNPDQYKADTSGLAQSEEYNATLSGIQNDLDTCFAFLV